MICDVSRNDRRCYGYPEPKTQTVTMVALPWFALTQRPMTVPCPHPGWLLSFINCDYPWECPFVFLILVDCLICCTISWLASINMKNVHYECFPCPNVYIVDHSLFESAVKHWIYKSTRLENGVCVLTTTQRSLWTRPSINIIYDHSSTLFITMMQSVLELNMIESFKELRPGNVAEVPHKGETKKPSKSK